MGTVTIRQKPKRKSGDNKMTPLTYAIYKGTGGKFGALQFRLSAPHFYCGKEKDYTGSKAFEVVDGKSQLKQGWQSRDGAIFLEATSAKDKNVYDWENKIVMALSVNDMGKVLLTLVTGNECSIMHDPDAKSEKAGTIRKFLNIISPNGTTQGCMVSVSMSAAGQTKKHTVPMTGDEVMVLRQLLQTAISKALSW